MKPLKIGVVGAGGISSRVHMPALRAIPEKFEFVALAELNEELGRKYARDYNVRYYKNHLEMMDNEPDLDAVDICTAPISHHIVTYDVASRGIHINVEKPVAMTLATLDFMYEAVRANNVHFQVSENYPFMPWDTITNKMCDLDMFGEIAGAWLRTPVNDFSFDIFVHHYAQLRSFMRCKPKNVVAALREARIKNNNEKYGPLPRSFGEEPGYCGNFCVEFENGVDATFEFFPFHYKGDKKDYYFAGDLRRLVGTKLIATDNVWPIIMNFQPDEFHVLQLNDDMSFRKIPIEIDRCQLNLES